jgi:Ca2+-binding RTX toxin-like protein
MENNYIYIPTSQDAWQQYIKVYPELAKYGSTAHFNAFTHAYVSARLLQNYGEEVAKFLGYLREFFGIGNSDASHKQDFFNNMIGRDLVKNLPNLDNLTPNDIAKLIKSAADSGELALNNQDPRLDGEIFDDYWSLSQVKEFFKDLLNSLISDTQIIGDTIQSSFNLMFAAEQTSQARRVDPLSLDLEGDGVELINVDNSSVFFDLDLVQVASLEEANDIKNNPNNTNYNPNAVIHTSNNIDAAGNITPTYYIGDGLKEQVGWIKSDDGILTLDKNNNNSIDNILELFGKVDKTGTEELREYDLNNATNQNNIADGIIDQKDNIFSQLKIWQDLNQNGVSESNELRNLTDLNITSINLDNLTAKNQVNEGNLIISQGTFTQNITNSDNSISQITKNYSNLDLAINQSNSVSYNYTDQEGNIVNDYDLNLEVLSLPQLRGYGDVEALSIAASRDQELLDKLKELNSLSLSDGEALAKIENLVEEIIYIWAKTDDLDSQELRGSFSNKKLTTLEKFRGEEFSTIVSGVETNQVQTWQVNNITLSWLQLVDSISANLLAQSVFKETFAKKIENISFDEEGNEVISTSNQYPIYDYASDSIDFNNLSKEELYQNIENQLANLVLDISTAEDQDLRDWINQNYAKANKLSYLNQIEKVLINLDESKISEFDKNQIESDFNNFVNDLKIKAGTTENDIFIGNNNDENNQLIEENLTIIGDKGDDNLKGLSGDDVYIFNLGDGKDIIDEANTKREVEGLGDDTILFGAGINKEDIYFQKQSNSLIIKFKNSLSDQITIQNQINSPNFPFYSSGVVEKLIFANGDQIDISDVNNFNFEYLGSSENDIISGSEGNDIIYSFEGDDIISASTGNDYIDAGKGDDQIEGFSGDDHYFYRLGDGHDKIIESGGVNKIEFAFGIKEEDIYYSRNNNGDLIIKFRNNDSDSITIDRFLTLKLIDQLEFNLQKIENDQPVFDELGNAVIEKKYLNLSSINSHDGLLFEIEGTSGNDQINSTKSIINAYEGDDVVSAYGTINLGAGNDSFSSNGSNNIIDSGTGNDSLSGSSGNDTYLFSLGDGIDTIYESSSNNLGEHTDIIRFRSPITAQDIETIKSNDDLILKYSDSDQVIIKNYLATNSPRIVEKVEFIEINENGEEVFNSFNLLDLIKIKISGTENTDYITLNSSTSNYADHVEAKGGNDDIQTGAGNDYIDAGDGDDKINSGDGNDIVVAGKGNDIIETPGSQSNRGDDIYIFNLGDGKDYFSGVNPTFTSGNDTIRFGEGLNINDVYFNIVNTSNIVVKFKNNSDDQITIISSKVKTLEFFDGSKIDLTNNSVLNDFVKNEITGTDAVNTINGTIYQDKIYGLAGNDTLDGKQGNDVIYGGDGNDYLRGQDGNDVLVGGKGDDNIVGDSGDDIYQFNIGDGVDIYTDTSYQTNNGGNDKILLGEGINKEDIFLSRSGDSIEVNFKNNSSDKITISRQLYSNNYLAGGYKIESIEFNNGDVIDLTNKNSYQLHFIGSDFYDNIDFSTNYSDYSYIIEAKDGFDQIKTGSKNDIINAGKGNDTIYSASGDDTIIYSKGDGADNFIEARGYGGYGGNDTLKFTSGITRDQIYFTKTNNNLDIKFKDIATDSISIRDYFLSDDYKIENIEFADGSNLIFNSSMIASNFNNNPYLSNNLEKSLQEDASIEISINDLLVNSFDVEDASAIRNLNFDKIEFVNAEKVFDQPNSQDSFYYQTANGRFTLNFESKTINFTANKDYFGSETISYQIKDSKGALSNIANINLNIEDVAEPIKPTAPTLKIMKHTEFTSPLQKLYYNINDVMVDKIGQNQSKIPVVITPDGKTVSPDAINSNVLTIQKSGEAFITFKNTTTSNNNSIGYYIIAENGEITNPKLLFNGAKQVKSGTEFSLGNLEIGTQIGFFTLVQGQNSIFKSANNKKININKLNFDQGELSFINTSTNETATIYDSSAPKLIYTDKTNNIIYKSQKPTFHSFNNVNLNADKKVHSGAGWDQNTDSLLIGFEDTMGGGDRDYNDILFYFSQKEDQTENNKLAKNTHHYTNAPSIKINLDSEADISSAIIKIANYQDGDVLMFDNNNFVIDEQSGEVSKIIDLENAIFEDLNLTLNKTNDQITITGDNNSENYQEVIRSIKYIKVKSANIDKTNLSKEIEITITDQQQNQSTITQEIRIFDKVISKTNSISSSSGNNQKIISGDDNANLIIAKDENAIIDAKAGNDSIKGSSGNDSITAGSGADEIIGNIGNDQFIYNSISDSTINESDLILDFIQNEDIINLENLDFDSINKRGETPTSDNNLEYYFDEEGNTIISDANSNFAVKLINEIELNNDDFIF